MILKKLHVLTGLAILAVAAGCTVSTVVVNRVRVDQVKPGQSFTDYASYYALPRTVLDVEVVVEKTMTRPGPFVQYASRLLGITTPVITHNQTKYKISEIRVSQHAEKDPGQIYRLSTEGDPVGARVTLTPEGILAGINLSWQPVIPEGPTADVELRDHAFYFPQYPDLSMRKNLEIIPDTTYRVLRTDTSFIKIPLLKSQVSQKDLFKQAEEAANVIMKLRKRRFYMLNGEYAYRSTVRTPMPEGATLEIVLKELARMEYDYVSLFIGRSQTETEVYHFLYTPKGEGITEATVLFSFSDQQGILPAEDTSGDPVRLQLTQTGENPMDRVTIESENPKYPIVPGLAYRIPEKMMVEILHGKQSVFTREMLIAQAGRVDFLPSKLVADPQTAIEFYPMYGSLKSIYTKGKNTMK
ncbi:MAG: DUF4831 family protein [Bacteroidales bacterium]|nr:DUF4831 family protein [Bacteroidales bacterium]